LGESGTLKLAGVYWYCPRSESQLGDTHREKEACGFPFSRPAPPVSLGEWRSLHTLTAVRNSECYFKFPSWKSSSSPAWRETISRISLGRSFIGYDHDVWQSLRRSISSVSRLEFLSLAAWKFTAVFPLARVNQKREIRRRPQTYMSLSEKYLEWANIRELLKVYTEQRKWWRWKELVHWQDLIGEIWRRWI